jgi:hypothetical protein
LEAKRGGCAGKSLSHPHCRRCRVRPEVFSSSARSRSSSFSCLRRVSNCVTCGYGTDASLHAGSFARTYFSSVLYAGERCSGSERTASCPAPLPTSEQLRLFVTDIVGSTRACRAAHRGRRWRRPRRVGARGTSCARLHAERLKNLGVFVDALARNRPVPLHEDEALEIVWALTSLELHQLLRRVRGWTRKRHSEWLARSLSALLVPESGPLTSRDTREALGGLRRPPYDEREEGVDPCGIRRSRAGCRYRRPPRFVAFCAVVRPWCDLRLRSRYGAGAALEHGTWMC